MKVKICEVIDTIIEDKTGQSIATCWRDGVLTKEFVRRWNAFEEDGIVGELVVACEVGLDAMKGLMEIGEKIGATKQNIIQHKEHIEFVETAIAKAKPE